MKLLLMMAAIFLSVGCTEPSVEEKLPSLVAVGLTYGECTGDCTHFVKLEEGRVFLDAEEGYLSDINTLQFRSEALGQVETVLEMEALAFGIPAYLEQTEMNTFGCPDCSDGGALHLVVYENDETRHWVMDTSVRSNPQAIQPWVEDARSLLNQLPFY